MKKLLAWTLALALACALCVPALAAEADEPAQPRLTLVVNGVESDVAISASNWTTYADADALRGILGVKAAAPTYAGPVPVREAAENAGWEVQWYDGGSPGADQQVCLWNKAAFVAEVKPRTESFQKLCDTAAAMARTVLSTETPRYSQGITAVTLQPIDAQTGAQPRKLELRGETVWQKGVLDCTVTFSVDRLLKLFPDSDLAAAARSADPKALRAAGKAEFIVDCNAMGFAANIPLLGLMDEELKGWQTLYIPGLAGALTRSGEVNCAEALFAEMKTDAQQRGGLAARADADAFLEAIGVFAGPDSVTSAGNTVTWTLETDKVNAALSKAAGDGALFKHCDLAMTFNPWGDLDMTLALQADAEGGDMDLAATAQGDLSKFTGALQLRLEDLGTFDVTTRSTNTSADHGPRQLAQVEREWVRGDFTGTAPTTKP